MREIKPKLLIKIALLILGGGLLTFAAQDVLKYLVRAGRVNEEFVQYYWPQLNIGLIKKAAETLKEGR